MGSKADENEANKREKESMASARKSVDRRSMGSSVDESREVSASKAYPAVKKL